MKQKFTMILAVAVAILLLLPGAAFAAEPTPSPAETPTEAPTAAPTANPVLNLQLYLLDQNNYALAGYIATWDNDTQSIADKDGIASFPAVDTGPGHTLKIFTPDKKQIGVCSLTFVEGATTSISKTAGGNTYQINYSTPNATVYLSIVADPTGDTSTACYPSKASDTPLTPGNEPTAAPSPQTTDPEVRGYLVDQSSLAIAGATIQSTNDDTGESLSALTAADGSYHLRGMSEGRHTISATASDGSPLGSLQLVVQAGATTGVRMDGGQEDLNIKTGLGTLYMNLQSDGQGGLRVLNVSESSLASPARPGSGETQAPATASGLPTSTTVIIIVVVIAAAAIIIALIVSHNRKKRAS